MERLSTFGHYSADESDDYVGSSAATTVVRKKTDRRSSNTSISKHFPDNDQILTNKHIHQRQRINPLNYINLNQTYTGQQVLLTSGDIEAMTMRQFRMGSLGC